MGIRSLLLGDHFLIPSLALCAFFMTERSCPGLAVVFLGRGKSRAGGVLDQGMYLILPQGAAIRIPSLGEISGAINGFKL